MDDGVTLTDFKAALMDIKNDALPGLSELTAHMAKSWSAAAHFVVHEYINNLWLKHLTPL
jgi:hypothetical protein